MSILLNDNLSIQAPRPVDANYGPYASTTAANAAISSANRYVGLTVGIGTTTVSEYWYNGGIADVNLIAKSTGGGAGVSSFNTRTGAVTLTSSDVTSALGATAVQQATNINGGTNYQIPYQQVPNTTVFIPAPTTASTYLGWNGSGFVWGAITPTVNWATPGALGSTTPNSVYVAEGDANNIAFFDPVSTKKITSDSKFRADPDGNGTMSVKGLSPNPFSAASCYGYIAGGGGDTRSSFLGSFNNGSETSIVAANCVYDPDLGYLFTASYGNACIMNFGLPYSIKLSQNSSTGVGSSITGWVTPIELTTGSVNFNVPIGSSINGQSSIKSSSASAGVGYATGAGSSVTQTTSKSTAVTLNNICGKIQMAASSLAGNTNVSFTLNNSTIAATDVVIVNASNVGGSSPTANTYMVTVDSVLAGSCRILVRNVSAVSAAQALILNFAVIKAVQA